MSTSFATGERIGFVRLKKKDRLTYTVYTVMTSGRPNRSKIWYYSIFDSALFRSAFSGKTEPNIYRIKSKIKEF